MVLSLQRRENLIREGVIDESCSMVERKISSVGVTGMELSSGGGVLTERCCDIGKKGVKGWCKGSELKVVS